MDKGATLVKVGIAICVLFFLLTNAAAYVFYTTLDDGIGAIQWCLLSLTFVGVGAFLYYKVLKEMAG
ncbi:hypothetical protein RYZ26_00280 [Terasakiella sp. A23]|uniref:hypothetical protein n=1 Tax=Terasakiella sp. FCG-A23 TaxID=3080561 RepID=UPI002953CB89|nr:hypothetical protein [Terasakiella sp. A23]MDV7338009.1 hypothetical protein [Terasakiella sp. A23]